jgi:voltage-gated potassium channel
MFTALREMLGDREGRVLVAWLFAQILLGTLVYAWLEGWSPVDSLYFSVVTLATVGFGDLHPTTDPAKLFTIAYILVGLGVFAAFISELTKHRASTIARIRHHGDVTGPEAGSQPPGRGSTRSGGIDQAASD